MNDTDAIPLCALTGAIIPPGAPLWWALVHQRFRGVSFRTLLYPGSSSRHNRAVYVDPPANPATLGPVRDPFGIAWDELSSRGNRLAGSVCAVFSAATVDACDRHFRVSELAEAHLDAIRWASRERDWRGLVCEDDGEGPERRVVPRKLWRNLIPLMDGSLPNCDPWGGPPPVRAALDGDAAARKPLWGVLAVLRAAQHIGNAGTFPYLGARVHPLDAAARAERDGVCAMLADTRAAQDAATGSVYPPPFREIRASFVTLEDSREWVATIYGATLTITPSTRYAWPIITIRWAGFEVACACRRPSDGVWTGDGPPPRVVTEAALDFFWRWIGNLQYDYPFVGRARQGGAAGTP